MSTWQHDPVLLAVEEQPAPIGTLVAAFPGAAQVSDNPGWLDPWFTELVQAFAEDRPPVLPTLISSDADKRVVDPLSRRPATSKVRFISLRINWFRGFRRARSSVLLNDSLVVIEGRNSSGKTSLSEALEWLLTGALSRRTGGNPKELANCIANEFRPAGQSTWVKAELLVDGATLTLRRVLEEDYNEAVASACKSVLEQNGKPLSDEDEWDLLNRMFGGVHPILMQHTLREFVYNSPAERRRYFERLLQIDELTALIERAVVGDARLREFPCRTAPDGRTHLDKLIGSCVTPAAGKVLRALGRDPDPHTTLGDRLLDVAVAEFAVTRMDVGTVRKQLNADLATAREMQLPGLNSIRLPENMSVPEATALDRVEGEHGIAHAALVEAEAAVATMDAGELIVAGVLSELDKAGLLSAADTADQLCPLCKDPSLTLKSERIGSLRAAGVTASALNQIRAATDAAKSKWETTRDLLVGEFRQLGKQPSPELSTGIQALPPPLKSHAERAMASAGALGDAVASAVELVQLLAPGQVAAKRATISAKLDEIGQKLADHRAAVATLEAIIGTDAAEDPGYAAKAAWVKLAESTAETADQLKWEGSRKSAQGILSDIRSALIALRSAVIEGARETFTKSMTEVWALLRADSGGKFSKISIPEARGRGYKLEFEVKAVLNDGTADAEVDALRVFSESQVNVVGIAAYVTRANALRHSVLVFDDPVQSMDEEHFKSLSARLIPELLTADRQVIILTHSDSFARGLSHAHFARDSYATLTTTYSRKKGCIVEEGSRRVAERLKVANRLADDGKLKDGWLKVRLAVERLYIVAMKAADPAFDPDQWRNATAEDMWNKGAGSVILARVPDAEHQLKGILALSAKAAHDAASASTTDLVHAIEYIKSLMPQLRVGAG